MVIWPKPPTLPHPRFMAPVICPVIRLPDKKSSWRRNLLAFPQNTHIYSVDVAKVETKEKHFFLEQSEKQYNQAERHIDFHSPYLSTTEHGCTVNVLL